MKFREYVHLVKLARRYLKKHPPEQPILQFPLMPGNEQHQKIPLPPGQYYIVLDNSSKVGSVNPPWNPLGVVGGNVAVVSHVVELGEAGDNF